MAEIWMSEAINSDDIAQYTDQCLVIIALLATKCLSISLSACGGKAEETVDEKKVRDGG